jgi:hypothetical protein
MNLEYRDGLSVNEGPQRDELKPIFLHGFSLFMNYAMDCSNTETTPMTTSSDHRNPSSSSQTHKNWGGGEHWFELTATLAPESTQEFGEWLSDELSMLEDELDSFTTPNSLHKSIRRSKS